MWWHRMTLRTLALPKHWPSCWSRLILAFPVLRVSAATSKSWEPDPCSVRFENHPGVEDASRVEALLDPAHESDLGRVFQLEVVGGLGAAKAVFAGDRATQFHCEGEDIGHQLLALVRILQQNRQVHVAVTGVPAAGRAATRARRQTTCSGKEFRHRRPWHDGVDDVVRADCLRRPESLL